MKKLVGCVMKKLVGCVMKKLVGCVRSFHAVFIQSVKIKRLVGDHVDKKLKTSD